MVISDGSSDVCSSDLLSYEGQSLSLPNVANWGGRIGFDYRAPVGGEMRFQLSGSARYVGKSRLGVGPLLGREQGDYVDTAFTAALTHGTVQWRSEEHTSELQSLMRISYAVFCLKKKK